MLFVLACAALVLIVLAALGPPLLSRARAIPGRAQYDRIVYRDQLGEVERELARGALNPDEAGAARLEIQRRLLAVDGGGEAPASTTRSPYLAVALALCFILAAGGLYWDLGAPGLPDAPFSGGPPAETAAPEQDPHADLRRSAQKLEQKLQTDPNNADGWALYARTLSMLAEWDKAADAYRHAIDLGRKEAAIYAGYGEMQVMAANGIVPPAARDAFTAAVAADASNSAARYYLALADSQAGESKRAIGAWMELASGLPEGSPMREEIGRRVAEAAEAAGIPAPTLPPGRSAETSGPTQEQMQAAAEMTPDQRAQLIGGMIAKLAAEMKDKPDDLDGWLRLGRAYATVGQTAKAVDAYDHAAALKPDDAAIKLRTVGALLSGLKPQDPVPPRATALLKEVAAVAPDAPEVLWYLGEVAARDGHMAEAREKWTKLLAALPDGDDAKMVRAALDALKGK